MGEVTGSKYLVSADWDDVPHLTEEAKQEMLASTPHYLRDARSKGTPSLGAGAIYPVAESDIKVNPFDIPESWPRVFGLDVGWQKTAAIWGAWDRETDCVYLYTEHYRGLEEPSVHTAAINARGDWIPGVIDPAAHGRGQRDGEILFENYVELGLNVENAINAREAGIDKVLIRLSTGRLKVFSTCQNWFAEYRIYRRDKNGKVVKAKDHLMDATRYLVISGVPRAIRKPIEKSSTVTVQRRGDSKIGY